MEGLDGGYSPKLGADPFVVPNWYPLHALIHSLVLLYTHCMTKVV